MRMLAPWLLGLAFIPLVNAQTLRFQQISTSDGLSDNSITALFQDRNGFLWIGTDNGLNRYDGHHIRTWHRSDGLSGEHITDIRQDQEGTIWVAAHEGGLTCFSAEGEVTATFRPDPQDPRAIADVRITCLFDLNDSILMVGAEGAPVIFLDKPTRRFTYWKGQGPITPAAATVHPPDGNDWCNYISDLGDGRLAIGFLLGHRQFIISRTDGTVLGPAFRMDQRTDQTIVDALRVGNLLYGAGWQDRLHVHALDGISKDTLWTLPDECTTLLAYDSSHLLAGTSSNGLLQLDLRTGGMESFRHQRGDLRSISDDRVRALLRDRSGGVWVGTRNGLNLYAPQRWWTTAIPLAPIGSEDPPSPLAFSIAEMSSGEIVVCTTDGLYRYRPDGPMRHVRLASPRGPLRATCILEQAHADIIGAEQGVFTWVPGNSSADTLEQRTGMSSQHSSAVRQLPSLFQVRSIIPDTLQGSPTLVLGILGYGITLIDLDNGSAQWLTNVPGKDGTIGSNLVNKLVRDRNGTYWAGTAYGLYQWQLDRSAPKNTFKAFLADDKRDPLPANEVLDLLSDGRGTLWIATRNGGIASWDGKAMRSHPLPPSAGNTAYGLAMDRGGRVWCAARGCFAVLDTANGNWMQIPLQDAQGIPAVPACTQGLRDGRIAFISGGALHLFDPSPIRGPQRPPQPYLTALDLADTPIGGRLREGRLELHADEGMLHVAVSALDLSPMAAFRYTFELEGIDPVPRPADESGSLVYAALPAGTYRLFARTVAFNGASSAPVELAVIEKAAPIWQRWWFHLVIVLCTGAIAYAASRYRYRQKLKLQMVRNRIASDLHDEVGSSLSAITIGSQVAAQLSGNEDPQLRNLMARIGETSSASLRSMSDIVWAIDPKHDEGEALLARMRRISQELLESKGIDVHFTVSGGVEELKLSMNARKDLILIFKEAVHNCSKYASATTVCVSLHRKKGRLELSVKDDGRGFDPSLHPDGHGLGSMARRAKALRADLVVKSAPGMGTLVGVELDLTEIRD
jgi:signal transduction histidine kinase/sugar lactone lactonase YvrE